LHLAISVRFDPGDPDELGRLLWDVRRDRFRIAVAGGSALHRFGLYKMFATDAFDAGA
jgi:aromatic ring-opening dioxygenase catalytic subunit (LigB family)